ncbi:gonadotropin subunit beta-1-like [Notolabrus celidotus]|uniref:gonadotropin subunit beta-1-like n=1 Tax=Notolabrus celidotus TaxID=1203425 RepID=UPI00148FDE29|nr:gonadotropin subunit beta-1-like [Notolabrus celidotus]XP_034536764.1 gonadotropin subunit beta-1-like [Notolabrus celidotus]XP_034536765.1 gonadotropin subunit beta-1-like [Notolabrus celidotus]
MLLVVMAVVLAVAGARQGCSSGCHLTNIALQVESCGRIESVYTTLCVGQCYNRDPVYVGDDDWPEQKVCNGNWTYEVKQIPGCPVSITYPVATHCECTSCNERDTHCGSWFGDTPSCLSF